MNHKDKVKLARKMRSPKEALFKISIFNSAQWQIRSIIRRAKEIIRNKNANPDMVKKYREILSNLRKDA